MKTRPGCEAFGLHSIACVAVSRCLFLTLPSGGPRLQICILGSSSRRSLGKPVAERSSNLTSIDENMNQLLSNSKAAPLSREAPIPNDVKLVIWDLDDTFWNGSLAESTIEFIEHNAAIVRTLARRGIISSIASKNDHDVAQEILKRNNIWEYFVFPAISFEPKGPKVASIIQHAALRADNVLFIDDNTFNLREASYFNPGIMLAHPNQVMHDILDHPRLLGKPDPDLTRLKQYRLLERKLTDQNSTGLSNEDFLRASGVSISFDYNLADNFDRIVDLINRTNQLNYTKKRLKTAAQIDTLRASFTSYGISAACISCSDKYGDYGIIGFYVIRKNRKDFELIHFVFSCRIMNMGIEQFVYESLGRPQITIVPEVAYPLSNHTKIDWISVSEKSRNSATLASDATKLLLVGGCDLLQLASFCSPNRVEFVNRTEIRRGDEYVIRYDDPFFFLTNREIMERSEEVKKLPGWTYSDASALDQHLQDAGIIILSMREALNHNYVSTKDGVQVRIPGRNMNIYMQKSRDWFLNSFAVTNYNTQDRLSLVERSFRLVAEVAQKNAVVFILGVNTRREPLQATAISNLYNRFCQGFCADNPDRFHFVDVDTIVPSECLVDHRHFTRDGYYELSKHIMKIMAARSLEAKGNDDALDRPAWPS